MPSRDVTTRTRVQFIWHATTSELSGAGAQKNLVLSVNQATGSDYDSLGQLSDVISTLGTMFNRWRLHSCSASWCGAVSSTNTETSGIKYVPETLTTKQTGDWFDFVEGHNIAFHLPYQTTVSKLHLNRGTLARAGLPWLECSNGADNTGSSGTLCFFTSFSTAEAIRIHMDLDIEFAALADDTVNSFALNRAGGAGPLSVQHVLSLGRLVQQRSHERHRCLSSSGDGDGFEELPADQPTPSPSPSCEGRNGGRAPGGTAPAQTSVQAVAPRPVRR